MPAFIAKSYARIHRKNLINFGVLPLVFDASQAYETVSQADVLQIKDICTAIQQQRPLSVHNLTIPNVIQKLDFG